MGAIVGAEPYQDPWRKRQFPRQPSPQEIEQLRQLAGRGLQPTPGPPQQQPPPQMPPKPYQYPQLTESQQSRANWMGPIEFLTGAFNKNPGQALMGAMTGRENYESGALYDNYLDKRLKDPTLTKVQRDALYARRHKEESFSSTYGPFNAYSTASRRSVRRPKNIGGGMVQDYNIPYGGGEPVKWGLEYPRNADQGVKKPTAKDTSHYTDIKNARRRIMALDPVVRRTQVKNVQTKRADEVTAKLYELASSKGHPDLDDGLDEFMQELYGDLIPQPGDGIPAPVVKPPGKLSQAWDAVGRAYDGAGSLYDSMTDPMRQTDSESALDSLEEEIRRNEGYNSGDRY